MFSNNDIDVQLFIELYSFRFLSFCYIKLLFFVFMYLNTLFCIYDDTLTYIIIIYFYNNSIELLTTFYFLNLLVFLIMLCI